MQGELSRIGTVVEDLISPRETSPWTALAERSIPHEAQATSLRGPRAHKSGASERRNGPRYEVVEDRLWVEWWDAHESFGRSARLINVSRHGAMIVAATRFRDGQLIRLYLEEPAPQVAVPATVIDVVQGTKGFHQVRLKFRSPCPEEFIQAAAHGFEKWLAG